MQPTISNTAKMAKENNLKPVLEKREKSPMKEKVVATITPTYQGMFSPR